MRDKKNQRARPLIITADGDLMMVIISETEEITQIRWLVKSHVFQRWSQLQTKQHPTLLGGNRCRWYCYQCLLSKLPASFDAYDNISNNSYLQR